VAVDCALASSPQLNHIVESALVSAHTMTSIMGEPSRKPNSAKTRSNNTTPHGDRNAPDSANPALIPALEMLREEIGEDVLYHLHREGNGGLDLDFQSDPRVLLTHLTDGLRIGKHEISEAHGWAYYIKKSGRPAWNVWLYDEKGEKELIPKTKVEKKAYDYKKGLKMTYENFCYDDEFESCETTEEVRALALYFFMIHAEEEGQNSPKVTISDKMVETLRALCDKQQIENERVVEGRRLVAEEAADQNDEEYREIEEKEVAQNVADERLGQNKSHAEVATTSRNQPPREVKARPHGEDNDQDLKVAEERVEHDDKENTAAFPDLPSRAHSSYPMVPELKDSDLSESLTDPSKAVRSKRRPSSKTKKTKQVVEKNGDSFSDDEVPHIGQARGRRRRSWLRESVRMTAGKEG
jgi:hypothetical protein